MTTNTSTGMERVMNECPDFQWITRPSQLKRLSKDFSWFSPVLKEELASCEAQAVIRPKDIDEIKQIVRLCFREKVPITLRGAGSGNYGQAVPLYGGLVMDMSKFNQVIGIGEGVVSAQAGIRLIDLEQAINEEGGELRCMPSTFRMATLGGLLCGGFGGVGSINYGPLSSTGTLLGARILTIEDEPRIISLDAEEMHRVAHTYGTTGIVLEIDIAFAPAQPWVEQLIAFPTQESAVDFAFKLANMPAVVKREIAYFEPSILHYFNAINKELNSHDHAIIVAYHPQSEDVLKTLVMEYGGKSVIQQISNISTRYAKSLTEYCWNHTTLHALSNNPQLTYLQTMMPIGEERQALKAIQAIYGAGIMQHLEFIRSEEGHIFCAGLPLLEYVDEKQLKEVIERLRALGIHINDPHTTALEGGKHAGQFDCALRETKQKLDPYGLLNPGKMTSFVAGQSTPDHP